MKFIAGDEAKESIRSRGLSFELILENIQAGNLIDILDSPNYEDQLLAIINIDNYAVIAPFEIRGDYYRIITAYKSRKYTKLYL